MRHKRTLPQIRERLIELAEEHGIPELAELAHETKRNFNGRRAPAVSQPLTDELAARIRVFASRRPERTYAEIAQVFDVNIGRVSEALFGKRGQKAA